MFDVLDMLRRIDELLKLKHIPKSKFYAQIKISDGAVSQWRTGRTKPSLKSISRIADALNVSSEYLMYGIEQKEKAAIDMVDDDLREYLDELRNRPEQRMLFSVTKNATKAQIEAIVKMVEEMQKNK